MATKKTQMKALKPGDVVIAREQIHGGDGIDFARPGDEGCVLTGSPAPTVAWKRTGYTCQVARSQVGTRAEIERELVDSTQARLPPFAGGVVGAWVIAVTSVYDEDFLCAKPGGIGHIIELRPGYLPTIYWERTKHVSDCEPELDFDVLCGPGGAPPVAPASSFS